MKSVIAWSIGLLFGLGLMALGLFGTADPTGGKVLCGSEEMRPGETCEKTQYGQKSTETYEEKRQEAIDDAKSFEGGGRWVTFGIGTVIAAGSGWRLVVAVRRRAKRGSAPAAQTAPGFGPQPGLQPQGYPVQQNFQPQQGFAPQQGFPAPQPGFPQQQPGFAPPQQPGYPQSGGFQQPPPPGYQPPRGPHQQ